MTKPDTPTALVVKRDEKGRPLPGQSLNPRGKPAYPDWLKAAGPEALQYIVNVATGKERDVETKYRLRAAEVVVERVWGKPDANINVDASTTSPVLDALLALAKPKEQEPTS